MDYCVAKALGRRSGPGLFNTTDGGGSGHIKLAQGYEVVVIEQDPY